MDAASRWETEAIRESADRRRGRPVVSGKRTSPRPEGEWVTLREASDATGIPVNTLRKWCRKDDVASYLESDGDLTLRIVDLVSVRSHARDLGRDTAPIEPEAIPEPDPTPRPESEQGPVGDGPQTMIVPVDAWNKMLNQLGNLHEAGQQLAEARERAAKAETEVRFLRERLAELRDTPEPATPPAPPAPPAPAPSPIPEPDGPGADGPPAADPTETSGPTPHEAPVETTSFFRYVVRGWRGRKR